MEMINLGGRLDVAQLLLYAFWFFFAGLIWYLHRENKREGYPLENDRGPGGAKVQGFPPIPAAKTYRLTHGRGDVQLPRASDPQPAGRAIAPAVGGLGHPLVPEGDPMTAGIGPGAFALRSDRPDLTVDGEPRIVPMRTSPAQRIAAEDPDPRGMKVTGADGKVGGTVRDVWVDRSEEVIRYLELEVPTASGSRVALLPTGFARISRSGVHVDSINAAHFAQVPATRSDSQITLLEEDQVAAFYGAGTLYANSERQEPFL